MKIEKFKISCAVADGTTVENRGNCQGGGAV